jgi:hypothetical protein
LVTWMGDLSAESLAVERKEMHINHRTRKSM